MQAHHALYNGVKKYFPLLKISQTTAEFSYLCQVLIHNHPVVFLPLLLSNYGFFLAELLLWSQDHGLALCSVTTVLLLLLRLRQLRPSNMISLAFVSARGTSQV